MNADELQGSVEEMLGFRVTERENDAVLVRTAPPRGRSSVRPATREEVMMYLRLLGLSARLDSATNLMAEGAETLARLNEMVRVMGEGLQVSDARIKELMAANKGLGEEREFLAEVHEERIKSMQAKHDAALIAAAERMQAEWLAKLEHAEEERDSAQEMASQMHAQLSTAEEKIIELKAEVASLQEDLAKFEMVEGHG